MNLEYRGYATAGQPSVLKPQGLLSLQVMRPHIADMLTAEQPVPGLTTQNVSPFSHQLVRVKCAKGHEVELYLGNISRYSAEELKGSPPCKYCSGSALCEDNSFALMYPDLAEHLYDTLLDQRRASYCHCSPLWGEHMCDATSTASLVIAKGKSNFACY